MDVTFIYGCTRLITAMIYIKVCGLCTARKTHMLAFTGLKYYAFSMGIWDFLLGLYYLVPDVEMTPLFLALIYAVVPFSSFFFFYFAFCYTFPDKVKNCKIIKYLLIIPIITVILSLTSHWHNFFITYDTVCYYTPIREITEHYHFWFYVHSIYSYLLVIAGMVMLVYKVKNPLLQNKKECILVIISAGCYIFSNFLGTFLLPSYTMWISVILKVACIFTFYFALYSDESEKIRFYGQTNVIETMALPVFFLNLKGRVIYANNKGKEVCPFAENLGREQHFKSEIFDLFIDYPLENDLKVINNNGNSGQVGSVLQERKTGNLYFLCSEKIANRKNKKVYGTMLMLLTFSSVETVFASLEDKAFKDPLCNLYNRHFLELKKVEFIQKNIVPIALLVCDIDSLKSVNDKFGHDVGDEYILLCADVLKQSVRSTDYVFRIGGDEFLIVIPNADYIIASKVTDTIHAKINSYRNSRKYSVGITVGYTVAETLPVDFDEAIKEADSNMYLNKHKD